MKQMETRKIRYKKVKATKKRKKQTGKKTSSPQPHVLGSDVALFISKLQKVG